MNDHRCNGQNQTDQGIRIQCKSSVGRNGVEEGSLGGKCEAGVLIIYLAYMYYYIRAHKSLLHWTDENQWSYIIFVSGE